MGIKTPNHTLWLDCEFTGLSLDDDLLLEIGAIVTEGLFNEIDVFSAVISQEASSVELRMAQDEWWPNRPDHRQKMLDEISQSTTTVEAVDEALAGFVQQYFSEPIIPAGSSPSKDRLFVERDLPKFSSLMHYRTIDVSSFKEVARRFGIAEYPKSEQHRAINDARESIDELKYLLNELGSVAVL